MASTLTQIGTLRARIADLDVAIKAAYTGQSYSLGGRTLTRQDLPALRDERTLLIRNLKQAQAIAEGATTPGVTIASWA